MKDQRVLVTGGAGFIGSNLANELADENDVVAIDDCYLGDPTNLDSSVEFYNRSVLDDELPVNVDVVFHLAALSSYEMHESSPCRGVRVNIEGFANTVEQARRQGCDTVVYASTSSIYGSRVSPSPENLPVEVNTGYEASKLAREQYAEYFHNHYGLSIAGMRLFSVYQGYGGAEEHKGRYANVIAQFAADIAEGRPPKIYGDGTQTRDFTHVDDIVRGLERAAEAQLNGVYNLGTGQPYSFNSIVDLINDEFGTDISPTYVENPIPEDVYVYHTCADITKMQRETGWAPEIALKDGITRVCAPHTRSATVDI